MPKNLLNHLAPDSVQEFRAAALVRFAEGDSLVSAAHGVGAIHLWGYAAEMSIKAGYFSLLDFASRQVITMIDLRIAVDKTSIALGLVWPPAGKLHNVEYWARLLIAHRRHYGFIYAVPGFERLVVERSQCVYHRWRETLRYHKNHAYQHEVRQVRAAARWLLDNALSL